MGCKDKYYVDGEYTLCSRCKLAPFCTSVKFCFGCGRVEAVFYSKRLDLFTCSECLYRFEGSKC